jgi:UDP:flavonoid glycosyltransferase YjiC (YdhE family)
VRAPGVHPYRDADRIVALVPEQFGGPGFDDWPPLVWGGFSAWQPERSGVSEEIQAFLDGGDAPVVVSLGSSAAAGAERRFAAIARAATDVGRRALVVTGSEPLRAATAAALGADPAVACVGFAPLGPLIERSCAAVISGALGTLGLALDAGTPAVVVPSLFDQQWNGRRVEQLGLGLVAKRPNAIRDGIEQVITDESYAARSAQMADAIRGQDGAGALTNATLDLIAG